MTESGIKLADVMRLLEKESWIPTAWLYKQRFVNKVAKDRRNH